MFAKMWNYSDWVHDEHVQRHGLQRQVVQLIKNLMRVFALMGLGPLPGATGETAGDLDFLQDYASSIQPGFLARGTGGNAARSSTFSLQFFLRSFNLFRHPSARDGPAENSFDGKLGMFA